MKINTHILITYTFFILFLCSFQKADSESTGIPVDLKGTWKISSFADLKKDTVLHSLSISLIIDPEGICSGFLGCNNFRTTCKVKQDSISFADIIRGRKFCFKEYMDLEDHYIMVLSKANRYYISRNILFLFEGKKKLATFIKE
jgi:heat shock protein HslJ